MTGWKPAAQDRPDLVLNDLEQSVVLEVKASELMVSEAFPTKCTLRFPRVLKIRYDKSWNDAMKRDQLEKLISDFQQNLNVEQKKRALH